MISVSKPSLGMQSGSASWPKAPPEASKNIAAAAADMKILQRRSARRALRDSRILKLKRAMRGCSAKKRYAARVQKQVERKVSAASLPLERTDFSSTRLDTEVRRERSWAAEGTTPCACSSPSKVSSDFRLASSMLDLLVCTRRTHLFSRPESISFMSFKKAEKSKSRPRTSWSTHSEPLPPAWRFADVLLLVNLGTSGTTRERLFLLCDTILLLLRKLFLFSIEERYMSRLSSQGIFWDSRQSTMAVKPMTQALRPKTIHNTMLGGQYHQPVSFSNASKPSLDMRALALLHTSACRTSSASFLNSPTIAPKMVK
mmetsp:Transcript_54813/g.97757  ORF Transcript_54813/g.97757 Transcript_54813/m.97757 type:complete len:315 (+) Transcript_54813:1124-2068(+)